MQRQYNAARNVNAVTGMLPAHVARIERIADDAVTLWLVAPGTAHAPAPYLPGQYITLALASPGGTLYRSYSLSSDGRPDRPWEITVKRQRDGAVSSFLCERATPGMLLS
ncbi:MAG: ferredoxin--NADP reductase, partial [Ktedonobacterales bacterium]